MTWPDKEKSHLPGNGGQGTCVLCLKADSSRPVKLNCPEQLSSSHSLLLETKALVKSEEQPGSHGPLGMGVHRGR